MADSKTASSTGPSNEFAQIAKADKQPIIVDIGKGSRKEVRKLRKGKPGKLARRVEETVAHLRETGMLAADAQPVVIVIRQRRSKQGMANMLGLR